MSNKKRKNYSSSSYESYSQDGHNKGRILGIDFSKNQEQRELIRLMNDRYTPVIYCFGNAGTGKTFTAVAAAIDLVKIQKKYTKVFYIREPLEVGKSLVDLEQVDYCKEMMEKAEKLGKKLLLPVDTVVCDHFPDPIDGPVDTEVVDVDKIPSDKEGLDIGTKTGELFASEVRNAKTVVWNGPMGVFENPTLARGTNEVAKALAECEGTTIIGGGDSAAAIKQLGYADKVSHVSTGGGASLEFLEGKELPGVVAADDRA